MRSCTKVHRTEITGYPSGTYASTAHLRIAAAAGLRLHALGPWAAGDGSAAGRPLRRLQLPPLPSPRPTSMCSAKTPVGVWTPMKSAARSVDAMMPTLAAVLRVDS